MTIVSQVMMMINVCDNNYDDGGVVVMKMMR